MGCNDHYFDIEAIDRGRQRLDVRFRDADDKEGRESFEWEVLSWEIIADTWEEISSSADGACAIDSEGGLWCWGVVLSLTQRVSEERAYIFNPLHGNSTHPSPVPIPDASGRGGWRDWTQVVRGAGAACGLRENGTAWCSIPGALDQRFEQPREVLSWGQVPDESGQGYWSDGKKLAIYSGRKRCGIRENGTLWCWGPTYHDESADDQWDSTVRAFPTRVGDQSGQGYWSDWTDIAMGREHSCGLREDGTLWCWGANTSGALGTDAVTHSAYPVRVLADDGESYWSDWTNISAGRYMTCGIRGEGELWCGGNNEETSIYDLGFQTNLPHRIPDETSAGVSSDWKEISVGYDGGHLCAIRQDDSLWCMGTRFKANSYLGSNRHQHMLTRVNTEDGNIAETWVGLSAGFSGYYAIRSDGRLWTNGTEVGELGGW